MTNKIVNIGAKDCDGSGIFHIFNFTNSAQHTTIADDFYFGYIPLALTTEEEQHDYLLNMINDYATLKSYTIVDIIWPNPRFLYKSYQATISQSAQAAPVVTNEHHDFNKAAAGVTFTWARSSTGVYTLTASQSIFTAGKTAVFISGPLSFVNAFKYSITSETVITFSSAVMSIVVSLISTLTDALFSNTQVEVRVYP